MSLSLYMDHHVPTAITEGLRRRGVDVLTASDDERERSADEELLHRATKSWLVFSQDRDLLVIAHRWQEDSRDFAGLMTLINWQLRSDKRSVIWSLSRS